MKSLTERIIELVPEIEECRTCGWKTNHNGMCVNCRGIIERRPITLADVLRAIGRVSQRVSWSVTQEGRFYDISHDNCGPIWNLAVNYEDQSDETKAFIAKILGVDETGV